MDENAITNYIHRLWDESIVPELKEYIRIPNKSVYKMIVEEGNQKRKIKRKDNH